MTDTIHSCGYHCQIPGCIKAQRDELVAKYVAQPVQPAEYTGHDSDCSLHNEPAFPAGPCDCRLATEDVRRATLRKHIDHISLLEYQLQHQKERFDYMEMMYKTLPVIGVFAKLEDHEEILDQPAVPVAQAEPLSDEQLERIAIEDEFVLFCDVDEFIQIARTVEQAHGIIGKQKGGAA